MTPDQFRRLALSLPDATESAHMGHPDFRIGGKIFATLGYPDADWAMISLPPEDQEFLTRAQPAIFTPVKGGWGKAGATSVKLREARTAVVREALTIAWRARSAKPAARRKKPRA